MQCIQRMKQLKLSPTKKEHGLKTYIFFDSLHHYPLITLSSSSFFTMQKKMQKWCKDSCEKNGMQKLIPALKRIM